MELRGLTADRADRWEPGQDTGTPADADDPVPVAPTRRSAAARAPGGSAEVLGIRFTLLSLPQLVRIVAETPVPRGMGPRILVTANVDHVGQLHRNPRFRAAYDHAWVATADGMPVYCYARLRGAGLPGRVTGADMFAALLPLLSPGTHRPFFVANSAPTATALAAYLAERGFDRDASAFDVPPFGFEADGDYSATLARRIREHGTTHLFMAVGSPKSELWVDEHRAMLGDCYAMSVGASLDFFVGLRARAPAWMQHSGFEWVWRLGTEPRRLARRYLVESWSFLQAVRHDLTGGGQPPH